MKKTYSCILFFLYGCAFAQNPPVQHRFVLYGTIKGTRNIMVYLAYMDAAGKFQIDSAYQQNGHFCFKGVINGPTVAFVTILGKSLPEEDDYTVKADGKNSALFFLEPKAIKAEIDATDFRDGKYFGSPSQSQFAGFMHRSNLVTDRYKGKNDSIRSMVSLDKAHKEEAIIQCSFCRDSTMYEVLRGFIGTHRQSYVTAYLVSTGHFKLDSLVMIYKMLPRAVRLSAYGRDIRGKIEKKERVAIGQNAPPFKQPNQAGDTVSLKDFANKYVLLQFWSSVNSNSRANNRELIPVYNMFKAKNFTILGISLDGRKTKQLWEAAIINDRQPWDQLAAMKSNHNQIVVDYDVQSVPANFLIGPKGRIMATDLRCTELGNILGKIFQ